MLAIKYLNNITWFENRFLQYKPVYPCRYDICYDDVMMMQYMMQYMMMYVHDQEGLSYGSDTTRTPK